MTHVIVIICHTPYSVATCYLIDLQLNTDFPYQFCFFTVKSPSVNQISVSQENEYKMSLNPSPFFTNL